MRLSDQPGIIVAGFNMSEVTVAKTGIFTTLNDLDSKIKDSEDPEPSEVVNFTVSPPMSTRAKLEHICTMLDEIRLTMTESAGQGFLFNAQYQIQAFLQNHLR